MLNWTLALLAHFKIISVDEAQHLSDELHKKIHPHQVKDALVIVEQLMKDYEEKNKKAED